jgi:hypothetical protein
MDGSQKQMHVIIPVLEQRILKAQAIQSLSPPQVLDVMTQGPTLIRS